MQDWHDSPSLATAADLVFGALAVGKANDARAAAEYLLEGRKQLTAHVVALAERALEEDPQGTPDSTKQQALLLAPDLATHARTTVHLARRRIARDARNTAAWLDMSRAYAVLGQKTQAECAMNRALAVSPNHRMVLRSAARLFIHLHDPERAAKLLSQHPRTRSDPWLLASEIATSSVAERSSKHLRAARQFLDSGILPAAHLAELHSALATIEFDNGAMRQARRHARESLIAPNDNCVAQARWLAARIPQIVVAPEAFDLAQSFEARCWRALRGARWNEALSEAHAWLVDEPYSSRPALIGSFIGVQLTEDYAFAAACARIGIQADPSNRTLHNNLAVALAYLGELSEAEVEYGRVAQRFDPEYPEFIYRATGGLLKFRAGYIAEGRDLYRRATKLAPEDVRARVLAHWLREELHAVPDGASTVTAICDRLLRSSKEPFTRRLVELVRARSERSRLTGDYHSFAPKTYQVLSAPTLLLEQIPPDAEP